METETRHNAPDPVTMPDCISPVAATVWLGWQPVAHVQFSGSSIDSITYLTGDQIGSPRLGTDDSQQVVWRWDSDAFGSVEPATDPDGDGAHINVENRFAGQYADGESGLRYNWNRYYDPVKGRYVTSDPIGLAGGVNAYGYVGGNPVGWVDLTGLISGGEAAFHLIAERSHGGLVAGASFVFGVGLGYGITSIVGDIYSEEIDGAINEYILPPSDILLPGGLPPYNPADDPYNNPYGPPWEEGSYSEGILQERLTEGVLPERDPGKEFPRRPEPCP